MNKRTEHTSPWKKKTRSDELLKEKSKSILKIFSMQIDENTNNTNKKHL
ncbi:MAG: hypothetical protein ACOYVG_02030 [Bacteroidota bacterium]|jgi:hypothetical protein